MSENLPYTYKGYSVNFSEPDFNDCGVRHYPKEILPFRLLVESGDSLFRNKNGPASVPDMACLQGDICTT